MKYIVISLLIALTAINAAGEVINIPRLADAIYHAEGGNRTRFPYGIKSIKTTNPRAVCIRTIQNRLKLWDGKRPFIPFLADKYCPKATDPLGHGRWIKNVSFYYENKAPLR